MDTAVTINRDLNNGIDKLEAWAKTVYVTNNDERTYALQTIQGVKTWRNKVVAFFADSKKKAHDAWKAIVANEKSMTDRLDFVERMAKTAVTKYDDEQERIRREAEAKAQAEAEEAARKERERLLKQAEKLKTPELKEERMAQAEAVVAPVVTIESAVRKQEGESYATVYDFEVRDIAQVPREWLVVNEKALKAFITSTKGAMPIPGIDIKPRRVLRVRA
jgi:hypothetical protein